MKDNMTKCLSSSYLLELLVHQSERPLCVVRSQETVDQRCPAQRELKLDVLLEVTADRGAVQVVTQVELSDGHQHVDLVLNRGGQQRQHALCGEDNENYMRNHQLS